MRSRHKIILSLSGILSIAFCNPKVFAQPTHGPVHFAASQTHPGSRVARGSVRPLILAHYLPWFQAKPASPLWGWHWTMNHFNPDQVVNGRRQAASQFYPAIGLYDSSDPDVLKCQVMLMKIAGIDGVIVDWYGNDEYLDFGANNRNTERLIPFLRQAGLKFAICYEDETIPKEIAGGVFPATDAVGHGQRLMAWMQAHFFSSPAYVRLDGRPLFLTFGVPYYQDAQWNTVLSSVSPSPLYLTENDRREPTASVGAFDWPAPGGGATGAARERAAFYARAHKWSKFIAAAYPRFVDSYQQAGVGPSWGNIDDAGGSTYRQTLTEALQSGAAVVQLVTWNDWGEGTQIEPSVEFGSRDLEITQKLGSAYTGRAVPYTSKDLELPLAWFRSKKAATTPATQHALDTVYALVACGQIAQARTAFRRIKH